MHSFQCGKKMDMKIRTYLAIALLLLSMPFQALAADDETWKVNLKDADIKAFITQVANITGYSFVIDPRVKGKVTIVSDTPMTQNEVYEMFQSVLAVHGFSAIPAGHIIKIVQQNDTKQEGGMPTTVNAPQSEQMITQVIQIKDTPALDLVPILRPMVAKYGHLAGVKSANALIVTDHASNVRRLEKIIQRLDGSGVSELEVVQLEEAWVGDIVDILTNLDPDKVSEGGKAREASGVAGRIRVVADERANRLIIQGEQSARERVKELIATLDRPSKFSGKASVIRLQHADSEELAELLKNLMGDVKDDKGKSQAGGSVSIHADTGLNALVVRAEPSVMSEIKEIVTELDVRRAQVLIEAAIVEVTGQVDDRVGVQTAALDQETGETPLVATDFANAGTSISQLITGIATGQPAISSGLTLGGVGQNGDTEFAFLVQALESVSNANLLSTPSIMTMDNHEAEIIVGQNVPFVTGSTSSTSNSNPFTTIKREDIGTTLKVTPHVQDGKFVRLSVEQSTESVAPTAVEGQADLITNKRSIQTQILAENGEIVMLGGLIRDAVQESESKVPFLGDIPIIGWLFRSTSESRVKQNLIVFLKPTVVLDKADNKKILRRKYDGIYDIDLSAIMGDDGIDEKLRKLFAR
ncbi:Type II secretory pathway, component PulD [Oceanobacter sp. RED65]|uniref:Type II secretory pathway, component PulD n=2 Tax=Bermanella marisrubri TaxID=207949 RepID=Q1N1M8_9GAMM|nr:Type II secretory pathway, component PulD [Oceanobacter sp. RED65] [Bermanella marisrubri]